MQSIKIILENAPENMSIPKSMLHKSIEVIFRPLDANEATADMIEQSESIESACGILKATHSVNLDQMELAIKLKGGSS